MSSILDIGRPYPIVKKVPWHYLTPPKISAEDIEDFGRIPIVVDHESDVTRLKDIIRARIQNDQMKALAKGYHLVTLDQIGKDAEYGHVIVIARDPLRILPPKIVRVSQTRLVFGRPYLVKFDEALNIITEVIDYELVIPRLDLDISSVEDMLRDRNFGIRITGHKDDVFSPLIFSYSQNNGPFSKVAGIRCAIELAAYDGVSEAYEELERVADYLSPKNALDFIRGEVEEHMVISPEKLHRIAETTAGAVSAHRGTYAILGHAENLPADTFAESFYVNGLDIPKNAFQLVKKDETLRSAIRAAAMVLSFMPVEYSKHQLKKKTPQQAGLALVRSKIMTARKNLIGGDVNYGLISDD